MSDAMSRYGPAACSLEPPRPATPHRTDRLWKPARLGVSAELPTSRRSAHRYRPGRLGRPRIFRVAAVDMARIVRPLSLRALGQCSSNDPATHRQHFSGFFRFVIGTFGPEEITLANK